MDNLPCFPERFDYELKKGQDKKVDSGVEKQFGIIKALCNRADVDTIINAGDAGTAWSGGEFWADEEIVTAVRKFVYNGGGFIGVGEPTAHQANGKFFQLSDVLGVEEECGFTLSEDKYNIEKHGEHFILDGIESPVDCGEDKKIIVTVRRDGKDAEFLVFFHVDTCHLSYVFMKK